MRYLLVKVLRFLHDPALMISLGRTPLNQTIVVDIYLTLWSWTFPMAPGSTQLMPLANQYETWSAFRLLPGTGYRNKNNPVSLECLVASNYSITALFGNSLDHGRLGFSIIEGASP